MRLRRNFTLVLLCCALLSLAACRGNAVEALQAMPVQLTVEGDDTLRFTPDKVSIPEAVEVVLTFRNMGKLNHNFTLMAGEVDLLNLSEANAVTGTNTGFVVGGQETNLAFQAPPVGVYTFVCVVPGHAAAGMVGTLTITTP